MNSNKKILFLGLAGRSSSEVRGKQVASASDRFIYNDQERIDEYAVRKCDTVIFIRNFIPSLAHQLRGLGKRVGFDLLDRPVADVHKKYKESIENPQIHWDDYCSYSCDFLIVNNDLTRRMILDHRRDLSVHVIPHHTCNFKNEVNDLSKTVKTVGYIGLPDQISYEEEIRSFLGASIYKPPNQKRCGQSSQENRCGLNISNP
jgi:hypothetical protein